jgi:hypothetical protein
MGIGLVNARRFQLDEAAAYGDAKGAFRLTAPPRCRNAAEQYVSEAMHA